jgi:ABC-2 type transport system ATP-binding protein
VAPLIRARDLGKSFTLYNRGQGLRGAFRTLFSRERRAVHAVRDLTFDVSAGEIVGLIGSNGAGKSTTVKMLTGILHPATGSVSVDGLVPHRDRRTLAKRIGVVFGQRSQLWWDLPLVESFRLLRWIYGVPGPRHADNLSRLVATLGLEGCLSTPVRQLSLGQRMRGDLVAALLHDPVLLFLDEPTIGLDVDSRDVLLELIQQLNHDRGVTVLLTTHDLLNLERISRRIMVIEEGRLIFDDQLAALKARYGALRRVLVQFRDPIDGVSLEWPGASAIVKGHTAELHVDIHRLPMRDLLARIDAVGIVMDVSISEPSIETVVRTLSRGATAAP